MKFLKKIIVAILTLESRLIIAKYKPFIIAVTGSVGKTSTKDAIYAVLKKKSAFVRKSEKSMNSELGLPLTVIGVPNAWHSPSAWLNNIQKGLELLFRRKPYPDCLILEIGADHPGDIKRVVKWLHPNISVLTRVSDTPVHVEFFKSPAEVFEEKAALVRGTKKGGTVALFADDKKIINLKSELLEKGLKVITFGNNEAADVQGSNFGFEFVRDSASDENSNENIPAGSAETLKKSLVCRFDLTLKNIESENKTKTTSYKNPLGRTGMYPLLAAAAVGVAKGLNIEQISSGLNTYEAPKGRMNVISGINGSTVIDDTYNSSPDAAYSALQTLRELTCSGRKIAVLADMMELGKYSAEEHRKIGKEAAKIVNILVTVGPRSKATGEEAVSNGLSPDMLKSFDSAEDAADFMHHEIRTNDIALVKGSQSMRMERVVKALLPDPGKAKELLVRQEPEWLEKA